LYRAVCYDDYNKAGADYSVTELIKPPRISALERRYADQIEEDASDRLWLLLGKSGHEVLRRSSEGGIVEERCTIEVFGKKISGQIDYAVAQKEIIDYKFVSMWAIKEGVKPEWEQQLNCYKEMCDQYGVEVKELKIVAILRDWSKPEARRSPDLPQHQVVVLPVRMWSKGQAVFWMHSRVAAHEEARTKELPLCTPEEVWEKPERYAVMKRGNKKATRVFDSRLDAGACIASQATPNQFEIEVRPAERPRCENYCAVSEFCEQFKLWKGQQT
jgi:hypothetical protein